MLCKCYQLIELCANARQNSILLRNDFFINWKLIVNYIHSVKYAANARVKILATDMQLHFSYNWQFK